MRILEYEWGDPMYGDIERSHYEWNGKRWTYHYKHNANERGMQGCPVTHYPEKAIDLNENHARKLLQYFRLTESDMPLDIVATSSPRTLATIWANRLP